MSLLGAPCIFCGWGGQGYWQRGTHSTVCPWHTVAGEETRRLLLRDVIAKVAKAALAPRPEEREYISSYEGALDQFAKALEDSIAHPSLATAPPIIKQFADQFRESLELLKSSLPYLGLFADNAAVMKVTMLDATELRGQIVTYLLKVPASAPSPPRTITCPHGTIGYCEPCALRDPGEHQ